MREWLSSDLGASIDLPKLAERLPKRLENAAREQLHAALGGDSVEDKRDRALILLLFSTGARISEVLRLDRADWAHERVTVRGKGDRERVLMVTANAREAVEDYLAARGDPSPALFISFQPAVRGKRENRLSDEGARYICDRLAKRLGIPPLHPHQLRHTLGTLLQETVGDARLTADTLGHVGSRRLPATRRSRKAGGAWRRTRCNGVGYRQHHKLGKHRPVGARQQARLSPLTSIPGAVERQECRALVIRGCSRPSS